MRAWVVARPGRSEVLELVDLPDPEPRDEWVSIRVRGFGLNRSELSTRQGHSGEAVSFPRVLGIECVGEVVDAGGTDLKAGQTVAAAMGGLGRAHHGGYAEMTSQPRANVFPIHTSLSWAELAALPETYLTAWGAVMEAIDLPQEATLLVRGGSSSVGMAAASIGRGLGAEVVGTTRQESKVPAMAAAGFDHVLIDRGQIAGELANIFPDGVHGVVDLVGTEQTITESLAVCRSQGTACLVGFLAETWEYSFFPWMPSTVRLTTYSSESLHHSTATPNLQYIVDQVGRGEFRSNIDTVFEFGDLVDAHRRMEADEATGKLVVTVP